MAWSDEVDNIIVLLTVKSLYAHALFEIVSKQSPNCTFPMLQSRASVHNQHGQQEQGTDLLKGRL